MLTDTTALNSYEDARAHRAAIVGDDFYLGYSYTKDWALSTYSDLENYDFYLRHYNAASGTWTDAQNVSNLPDKTLNVKEPRLVKTQGTNLAKCPVPANPADPSNTDPEQCQDKNTLIVGWGSETNVYSHVQKSVEGDIFYSRTRDKGATYEDVVVVPGFTNDVDMNRFEFQIRPTPAGNVITTVWNEADNIMGGTHAMASVSDGSGTVTPPPPPPVEGFDLSIDELVGIPDSVKLFTWTNSTVTITNAGAEASSAGTVTVSGVGSDSGRSQTFTFSLPVLAAGQTSQPLTFRWYPYNIARYNIGSTIDWTVVVTPDDNVPTNNRAIKSILSRDKHALIIVSESR